MVAIDTELDCTVISILMRSPRSGRTRGRSLLWCATADPFP